MMPLVSAICWGLVLFHDMVQFSRLTSVNACSSSYRSRCRLTDSLYVVPLERSSAPYREDAVSDFALVDGVCGAPYCADG